MRIRIAVTAWLLLASAVVAEKPQTVDEVLAFANAKMAGCQTWSAEFAETMGAEGEALRGRMMFKAPRCTRTETRMPSATISNSVLVVVDKNNIQWQEMTFENRKQVVRTNLGASSNNTAVTQWEINRRLMTCRLVKDTVLDGKPVWVVEGAWKEDALRDPSVASQTAFADTLRFYINQTDGFAHRVEYLREKRLVKRLDYSLVRFNEKLDDALFTYSPPPGASVIEINRIAQEALRHSGAQLPP